MALTITEDQLREFFDRAKQAERLTDALDKQLKVIQAQKVQPNIQAIDEQTKVHVISNLELLKADVEKMEDKITKVCCSFYIFYLQFCESYFLYKIIAHKRE